MTDQAEAALAEDAQFKAELTASFLLVLNNPEYVNKHVASRQTRLMLAQQLTRDMDADTEPLRAETVQELEQLDAMLGEECSGVGPSVIKRAIAAIRRYRLRISEAVTMGRCLSGLGMGMELPTDEPAEPA